MEMKTNNILVKRAASYDLMAVENQLAEAKRHVEVLDLIEKKADFVVVFEENTGKADMVPVSDENMHVSDDGVKDEFVADFVVVFEENTGKADMVPVSDENMHVSDDGVKDEFVVVPNSKLTGGEFHLFGE
ncbi:hypothetical protein Tco_1061078 [Tanacetum coccineum]